MPSSSTDNRLRGAQLLGPLNGTKTSSGFVGRADRLDFYKFALRRSSNVSLVLGKLTGNADVSLLNGVGSLIASSNQVERKPESIATTLEAGIYYIRINCRRGDSRYQLRLSAAEEPGASLSSASVLGELTGNQTYSNSIGSADQADYYKFTLSQISDFNASLSGLSFAADLNLIIDKNNNGFVDGDERVQTGYGFINDGNPVSGILPPGTYFVEVRTLNSKTSGYSLALSAISKPSNIPTDPGSDLATAYEIGKLSNSFTAQELVGEQDKADYYKFTLSTIGDFNATLSRLSATVGIKLILDANGNNFLDGNESIASGSGSTSSNDPISKTLPAGTYFLRTEYFGSYDNTTYDLTFSTVPKPSNLAADPGSSLGTAYNLGSLAGNLVAKDLVGSLDKVDYYKFSVDKSGSFNATLSGLSDGVNMALIVDANSNGLIDGGERLTSGYGSTSSNTPISRTLQAGSYFIEVTSSYSSNNTAYTLTLAG